MKNLLFLFLLFIVIIFSCNKTVLNISKNDLEGTWTLKKITGGIGGITKIPSDDITITFTKPSTYTSASNNNITATGTYTVTHAPNEYYYSETALNLFPDNNNESTFGIRLSNDSLILSEPYADGFFYTYIKGK